MEIRSSTTLCGRERLNVQTRCWPLKFGSWILDMAQAQSTCTLNKSVKATRLLMGRACGASNFDESCAKSSVAAGRENDGVTKTRRLNCRMTYDKHRQYIGWLANTSSKQPRFSSEPWQSYTGKTLRLVSFFGDLIMLQRVTITRVCICDRRVLVMKRSRRKSIKLIPD